MKYTTYIALALLFMVILTGQVSAQTYGTQCQPVYGGNCPTTVIDINKTVQDPQSGNYVDHLTVNNAKYAPDKTIRFKITVKNVSTETLTNVKVEDSLPSYASFIADGSSAFTANGRNLTTTIDKLAANETKTFDVLAKVVGSELPSNQGLFCDLKNTAKATTGSNSDYDEAYFCIEKPVLGTTTKGGLPVYPTTTAKETPKSGPEMLGLLGLLPAGVGGFFLRRKSA